ncbi:MAG: hypothetical protein H6P99_482 [Holophagaceae bacterium]|nr:hypothetical protein [Holophagaceae bacterium]
MASRPDQVASTTNGTLTRLKGGSLSGTYLLEAGAYRCVRKTISLEETREYGFIRWQSQLKRLQRFGQLFPGVFPQVLDVGREGPIAYFDLEYIEHAMSGSDFLAGNPPEPEVQAYAQALFETMDKLHAVKRPSCRGALDLYLYEEMERPLRICCEDPSFRAFLDHPTLVFNGVEIPSIATVLPDLYRLGEASWKDPWECYTHGNLTLENTLWVPATRKIWFIDPYEENVTDSVHNEYSQILQSSHARYEICNALPPRVEGNRVSLDIPDVPGIRRFNDLFMVLLGARLSEEEHRLVRLYEISQFTRMLPFKLHTSRERMIFFYALASFLAHQLLEDVHG